MFTPSSVVHEHNRNKTVFSQLLRPEYLNYNKTYTKQTEEKVMVNSIDSLVSTKKTEGEQL